MNPTCKTTTAREDTPTKDSPYVPLEREDRPTVSTACAAYYLNRRPQTLRAWASSESGPLRPLRINGRLAWPVQELRRMTGVAK